MTRPPAPPQNSAVSQEVVDRLKAMSLEELHAHANEILSVELPEAMTVRLHG